MERRDVNHRQPVRRKHAGLRSRLCSAASWTVVLSFLDARLSRRGTAEILIFSSTSPAKTKKRLNFPAAGSSERLMERPRYPWLTFVLTLALCWGTPVWSQDSHNTKVVHPAGAEFRQSLGQVLFSPEGHLYVAYRL